MKRSTLRRCGAGIAAAAACFAATGQTSVTLFGVTDVALRQTRVEGAA